MADQDININIGTNVDSTDLDQLKQDAEQLESQGYIIKIDVDSEEATDNINEFTNIVQNVKDDGTIDIRFENNAGQTADEVDAAAASVDNLQTSLNDIDGSSAGDAAEQVKDVGDQASESSTQIDDMSALLAGLGAGAVVGGFYEASMSADTFNQQVGALETNIGNSQIGKNVASEVAKMGAQYGVAGGEARSFANVMAVSGVKTSSVFGDMTKNLSGMAYLSKKTGESSASAQKRVEGSLIRIAKSGKISSLTLRNLGVSAQDLESAAGMSLDNINAKMENMTEAERWEYLNGLLNKTGKVQEGAARASKTLEARMNALQMKVGGVTRRLGELIMPTVISFVNFLADTLSRLLDWFDKLPKGVQSVIGGFVAFVAGTAVFIGGTVAIMGAIGKVNQIFTGFKSAMGLCSATKKNGECFSTLSESIRNKAGNIKSSVTGMGASIRSSLTSAGTTVSTFATTAGSKLKTLGSSFLTAGKNALTAAGNYAKNGLAAAANAIKTGIMTAATWLATAAQTALNFVMSINPIFLIIMAIAALVAILAYLYFNNETVRNSINALGAGLMYVGQLIYGYLIAAWNNLVAKLTIVKTAIIGFVLGALNNLRQFPGRVWALLLQVITRVTSWGSNIVARGKSAALNFLNGVVNYFKQLPGKIYNAISGVADKVKSVFSNAGHAAWSAFVAALDSVSGGLATIAINAVSGNSGSPWEVTHNNNGGYAGSPFEETSQNNNNQSGSKTGNTYVFKSLYMDKDFPNHVINVIDRRDELERMRTGV